jgi:hypothetical protein
MRNTALLSRSRRTLVHLGAYQEIYGEREAMPTYLREVSLQDNEIPIGVYQNHRGTPRESILISNIGLHFNREGGWQFLSYKEMQFIEPLADKENAQELAIHAGNAVVKLPVRGSKGKFRDIFEFLHFLLRAMETSHTTHEAG